MHRLGSGFPVGNPTYSAWITCLLVEDEVMAKATHLPRLKYQGAAAPVQNLEVFSPISCSFPDFVAWMAVMATNVRSSVSRQKD
jgi:hypothetical protein